MNPREVKKELYEMHEGLIGHGRAGVQYWTAWLSKPEGWKFIHEVQAIINKQVPQQPLRGEFEPAVCPDCEGKVVMGQRHCEFCGQKLAWEEFE